MFKPKINKEKVEAFYFKNYKKLMIIPVILLILSILFLGIKLGATGAIMDRDISLKGGIIGTVLTDVSIDKDLLQQQIEQKSNIRILTDFTTGQGTGFSIETSDISSDELEDTLEKFLGFELTQENYSVEETSSSLGEAFYRQLIIALIIAFILMGLAVFIAFKTLVPSAAVIFAAVTDLIVTVAILSLLGITISSAGIVAFLLVIGYSVDTDMLLTTRTIKRREGTLFNRMWGSAKTGLTMSITTIVALIVGLIVSNSQIIREMFLIIIIALVIDILTTYFTNAGILTWYCKRKNIQ